MSPETIGKYRLQAPLGESGRGVVYRAEAQDTNQTVALKLLPAGKFPDPATRQKFLEQARAAVRLSHPNLRQLYEVGESGDTLYLAMEYLEGVTLKSLLVGGRVEAETALAWGAEIAEALAAAHAQGVVHGDLRPAKVIITGQGTVKLLDPGLWRLSPSAGVDLSGEEKLLELGLSAAAVAQLAPEQIRGREPDARSDLFALGALLDEMITGRNPFLGKDAVQTMHLVLRRAPQPASQLAPQVPGALDAVLARALEKEPKARFRSAAELAAALRAVAAGEELPAEAAKPVVVVRWTRSLWWGIAGLGAVLAAWFAYLALTRP
ncbi:MAG: serine/threonine protein kinase [Acidobacteria bacterium]|nr:serine/threonine protein kinase [Acidobacteriota bacterium]